MMDGVSFVQVRNHEGQARGKHPLETFLSLEKSTTAIMHLCISCSFKNISPPRGCFVAPLRTLATILLSSPVFAERTDYSADIYDQEATVPITE